MAIKKEIRDEIVKQALNEIVFARNYKQGKIRNWQKNERMYYGLKEPTDSSRANVDLSGMSEHVETLLSKVDNPLTFKFTKKKNSQTKRVERLNALKAQDANNGFWDLKDIVGKKQCIIYGRAIYSYFADSPKGEYESHLENVDVYDFLIDPSAGGVDIEQAMYMGRYGVVKTRSELKKGVKDGVYLKYETEQLISGASNADDTTQEEVNKNPRRRDQNVWTTQTEITGSDKFKFWQWYTTYNGERYYLLLSENGCRAVRVEKLKDIFASNMFPFWTYAYIPDLTEFWTPSPCDKVRELIMAQAVSINQALDNAEQINKPMRVVSVGAVEDFASLKYRKDGIVKVKADIDVNRAYQTIPTPSINTPLQVYDRLDIIKQTASGVTAGAKGVSEEDKVAVYEGNQMNVADRFGLFNKSYSFGYKRFAKLYELGVREHLTKKKAIDVLGPDGIDIEYIGKRDIFRKDDDFGVLVEASNAEMQISESTRQRKVAFLTQEAINPNINPKKATEMRLQIAGFNEEEIRQLMDTSEFGNAELMAEADRDIEAILDGKTIKPNKAATTAYKQRFVDYMVDHEEDFDMDTLMRFDAYMQSIEPFIIENMVRMAENQIQRERLSTPTTETPPMESVQGQGEIPIEDNPELLTQ